MWVISSDQGTDCVRPVKPPKDPQAAEAQYNPSFWIRPDRDYTAGRSEAFDLYITHPKLSRKKIGFTLKSSALTPESLTPHDVRNVHKPSYELKIEAGEQGLLILAENGSDIAVQNGSEYTIRNGLQINAFADKKKECIMTFRWRPVHIFNRTTKKKELPAIQDSLASLGATISQNANALTPNETHTHALFPKFTAEPSAMQLAAANCQLFMVHAGWIDSLVDAARPESVSNGGDNNAQVDKCKLELDFERYWPSESRHFPMVDGREATLAEKKMWLPDPRRRDLFQQTIFIDYTFDNNIPCLITTAGGKVCKPDIEDEQSFVKGVTDAVAAIGNRQAPFKKFLVFPHSLFSSMLSPEQHAIVQKAKQLVGLDGYIGVAAIFAAIKNITPIRDALQEYEVPNTNAAEGGDSAPTPSMPGATADISFPATHPGDVAASAPTRPVDLKRSEPPAAAAGENRPNKKPRKLADRGVIDPFASLFAPAGSSSALAPPAAETGRETQGASQASSIGSKRTTSIDTQDTQSQAKYLRPDSKYAKLKRRVGQGQGSTSQLTPLSELELPEETEEPPVKKFKSFDPSIESLASQAAARQKEKEKQDKLADLIKDEDDDDVKPSTSKRKVAAVQPDSDEEATREATQTSSRKRATQAKEEPKASKKKAEEAAKAAQKESVYLQVKTGRRKIGKADADINEDFNNLRLKRSQIAESHKMGWNERDVFHEEMAEDAVWEAEDKSTFFQVRFVPMVRPKDGNARPAAAVDPRYAGKPNFKAFRPKTAVASTSGTNRPRARPQIELVAHEALGYGLTESYGDGDGPRNNNKNDDDDSDASIEMPMANLAPTRKGKAKAKPKAPAKTTRTAKGKKPVVSDSSDEDELDEDESATAREDSMPATKARGKAKESITIDTSSDEEDGKTFRGFSASNRITARKR